MFNRGNDAAALALVNAWRAANGLAAIHPTFSTNEFYSLDLRASKAIRLTSGRRLELIAQAFNVINRKNILGAWPTNALSPAFGTSVSAVAMRQAEVACGSRSRLVSGWWLVVARIAATNRQPPTTNHQPGSRHETHTDGSRSISRHRGGVSVTLGAQNPPARGMRWSKAAPFPEPEEELYGTVINGKFYVVGGFGFNALPPGGTISSTRSPRPQPMPLVAAAPRRMPGRAVDVRRGSCTGYDPGPDKWTKKKDIPVHVHHQAQAAVNGKLYIFGGCLRAISGEGGRPTCGSSIRSPMRTRR